MISTPGDDNNYYSRLLNITNEDGTPFFEVFTATKVCKECAKLEDPAEKVKCKHVKHVAHWKSSHKHKRLKRLYDGDEARALRELSGVVASDFTPCFRKDDIKAVWELPAHITTAPPRCIFTTADPNGG